VRPCRSHISARRRRLTHWCNEEFDALVTQAQATVDANERRKLYQQAQQILAEDGGVIVPGFLATIVAMREGCTGYEPNNNVNNHDWSSLACE
jgi:peptide/nickel transport system substrate-binding protein